MGVAILTEEQIPHAGRVVAAFGDPLDVPHRLDPDARILMLPGIDDAALAAAVETHARPPAPTGQNVRAEASRRMQFLVGARDAAHLEIVIANASREAIRLLRKGAENWTPDEAARATQLEAVDAAIEAIRSASNALEAMDPIPEDYADDARWS
ncbi:MAG: hypothetical protein GC150_17580 [Rhizobiales bacterium]|nr:hypothetical protein [Hyphomicrobiales bacterium]